MTDILDLIVCSRRAGEDAPQPIKNALCAGATLGTLTTLYFASCLISGEDFPFVNQLGIMSSSALIGNILGSMLGFQAYYAYQGASVFFKKCSNPSDDSSQEEASIIAAYKKFKPSENDFFKPEPPHHPGKNIENIRKKTHNGQKKTMGKKNG